MQMPSTWTNLEHWIAPDLFRHADDNLMQAPPDRKSIGAEVSYGIRFKMQAQAEDFMGNLAVELSNRMHAEGVVGRALTIKLMKQRDVSCRADRYCLLFLLFQFSDILHFPSFSNF